MNEVSNFPFLTIELKKKIKKNSKLNSLFNVNDNMTLYM